MLKIFIHIRKTLWLQPKWRILRIYTKTLSRKKIENLKDILIKEINETKGEKKAYLKGKLEIVNLLLQDEEYKKV